MLDAIELKSFVFSADRLKSAAEEMLATALDHGDVEAAQVAEFCRVMAENLAARSMLPAPRTPRARAVIPYQPAASR
ncbi:hypothetical protein [Telmatospirillum sp. J64-1]|uniref:hypothetical protein n=1 Tax=Telmatospirillum sp. J64-1 TaxID=2502183 RepID=UPI00115E6295|nr:hypothetical protein [Telmatospirillum sp. J64-1]